MSYRNIPFGYMIKNGIIEINEFEAEIVKRIFAEYLDGASLLKIAKKFTAEKAEYMQGKSDWTKNRICRMIEDNRYIGGNTYPPIINEDMYRIAQELRQDRNTQKSINTDNHIALVDVPVCCDICSSAMRRYHDNRRKITEQWQCQNAECGRLVRIDDSELLQEITDILNIIIKKPSLIQSDNGKDGVSPSLKIKRLSNEISRTLEGFSFDKEQLKNMIFECVAEKFNDIDSARHITDILKADFVNESLVTHNQAPLSTLNKELFDRTVSQIQLAKSGTVTLMLKNNQIIGKEQISDDTDTNSTSKDNPYNTVQSGIHTGKHKEIQTA